MGGPAVMNSLHHSAPPSLGRGALHLGGLITAAFIVLSNAGPAGASIKGAAELKYSIRPSTWVVKFNDPSIAEDTEVGEAVDFDVLPTNTLGAGASAYFIPRRSYLQLGVHLGTQVSTYQSQPNFQSYTITPGLILGYHRKNYVISPFITTLYQHTWVNSEAEAYKLGPGIGWSTAVGMRLYFTPQLAVLLAYEYTHTFFTKATGMRKSVITQGENISKGVVHHDTVNMTFQAKREGLVVGIAYTFTLLAAKSKGVSPKKNSRSAPRS